MRCLDIYMTCFPGTFLLEEECKYKTFQFIVHANLANHHFPPELQKQTTLIYVPVWPWRKSC